MQAEIQHPVDFFGHLVRTAEQVRVILRKAAHAQQPVQDATAFVAIHRAPFGVAHGQITVAAPGVFVHHDMERTVHWLQIIILPVDIHGRVHIFLVPTQVPADLPQIGAPDMRRIHQVIAASQVLIFAELFSQMADHPTIGVPEHQTAAQIRVDTEQIQLFTQLAMIALFDFFTPHQVLFQLRRFLKRRAIDALQHGILLAAAPISAGYTEQLDRIRIDLTRVLYMRAAT